MRFSALLGASPKLLVCSGVGSADILPPHSLRDFAYGGTLGEIIFYKTIIMKIRTYAFDFDGTITDYDGNFKGHEIVDEPRPEVIKAIRLLKNQGHKILI